MSVVSTVNSERDLTTWYSVIEGKNKERERKKKPQRLVKGDKEKVFLQNH